MPDKLTGFRRTQTVNRNLSGDLSSDGVFSFRDLSVCGVVNDISGGIGCTFGSTVKQQMEGAARTDLLTKSVVVEFEQSCSMAWILDDG